MNFGHYSVLLFVPFSFAQHGKGDSQDIRGMVFIWVSQLCCLFLIHSRFHTSHRGLSGVLAGDRGDEGKHDSSHEGKAISNSIPLQ